MYIEVVLSGPRSHHPWLTILGVVHYISRLREDVHIWASSLAYHLHRRPFFFFFFPNGFCSPLHCFWGESGVHDIYVWQPSPLQRPYIYIDIVPFQPSIAMFRTVLGSSCHSNRSFPLGGCWAELKSFRNAANSQKAIFPLPFQTRIVSFGDSKLFRLSFTKSLGRGWLVDMLDDAWDLPGLVQAACIPHLPRPDFRAVMFGDIVYSR